MIAHKKARFKAKPKKEYSKLYRTKVRTCKGIPLDPIGFGFGTWNTGGSVVVTPPLSFLSLNSSLLLLWELFPHWLSPPPPRAVQTLWSILPVGADLIPYPHKQSRVASPLFCKQKSKPLTACFWVWFLQITDGANCPEGVQSARAGTNTPLLYSLKTSPVSLSIFGL